VPLTDYNKFKGLKPTSQNDSGSTISKAQPIILKGEEEIRDGFEDGDFSNNPSWNFPTNSGFFSVQQSTVKNGTYSLNVDASSASSDETQVMQYDRGSSPTSIEYSRFSFWAYQDTQTDVSPTRFRLNPNSGNDTSSAYIETEINYDSATGKTSYILTTYNSSGSIGSESIEVDAGSWNRIELRTTSKAVELVVFDSNNNELASTALINFDNLTTYRYTQIVGEQVSGNSSIAFLDDISYEPEIYDGKQETGDIIVDFDNIADEQDIAVYDANDNLLDYEIESLDITNETGVIRVYNDWTRDDTVQAKLACGDNSADTDRQNVTGTWGNTGQNAVMVQHLQDDPLTATDSTSNNNDGTVNGAVSATGQFDGAGSFGGQDDYIDFGTFTGGLDSITIILWINPDDVGPDQLIFGKNDDSGGTDAWYFDFDMFNNFNDDSNPGFFLQSESDGVRIQVGTSMSTGTSYQIGATWSGSSNTLTSYSEGSQGNATSLSGTSTKSSTASTKLGIRDAGNLSKPYDGKVSEARIYNDEKGSAWFQADYDASPKAGQVFFSQDAAETTVTTETATLSTDVSIENRDVTEQLSSDVIVENQNISETFTQDVAIKSTGETITHDNDVAIEDKDVQKTFTQDATLLDRDVQKTFDQSVSLKLEDQQITFDQDLIISEPNFATHNQDVSIKSEDVSKQFSQDLILENANIPEQFNQDVAIKDKDREKTFSQDTVVSIKDAQKQFDQDVYVSQRASITFENSVVIAKQPAPDVQNPLTVKILNPTATYVKNLNPSRTTVKLKDIDL